MKHLISITIITLIIGQLTGSKAYAVAPESDETAKLNEHFKTADPRVAKLSSFLTAYNSPVSAEASHFIYEADRNGIDWKLVPAIVGVESTFGKFIPTKSYNGFGWAVYTGQQSGAVFKSWKHSISVVTEGLRKNYIDRGLVTTDQIGRIYAASPAWPWKVRFFMNKLEEFTPNSPRLIDVSL